MARLGTEKAIELFLKEHPKARENPLDPAGMARTAHKFRVWSQGRTGLPRNLMFDVAKAIVQPEVYERLKVPEAERRHLDGIIGRRWGSLDRLRWKKVLTYRKKFGPEAADARLAALREEAQNVHRQFTEEVNRRFREEGEEAPREYHMFYNSLGSMEMAAGRAAADERMLSEPEAAHRIKMTGGKTAGSELLKEIKRRRTWGIATSLYLKQPTPAERDKLPEVEIGGRPHEWRTSLTPQKMERIIYALSLRDEASGRKARREAGAGGKSRYIGNEVGDRIAADVISRELAADEREQAMLRSVFRSAGAGPKAVKAVVDYAREHGKERLQAQMENAGRLSDALAQAFERHAQIGDRRELGLGNEDKFVNPLRRIKMRGRSHN